MAPVILRAAAMVVVVVVLLSYTSTNHVAVTATAATEPWMLSAFATSSPRGKIRTTRHTKTSTIGTAFTNKSNGIRQLCFMAKPESDGATTSPTSSDPKELDYLKAELTEYLSKRKELGADEAAKRYVFLFFADC